MHTCVQYARRFMSFCVCIDTYNRWLQVEFFHFLHEAHGTIHVFVVVHFLIILLSLSLLLFLVLVVVLVLVSFCMCIDTYNRWLQVEFFHFLHEAHGAMQAARAGAHINQRGKHRLVWHQSILCGEVKYVNHKRD